jgi:hypothetical protein
LRRNAPIEHPNQIGDGTSDRDNQTIVVNLEQPMPPVNEYNWSETSRKHSIPVLPFGVRRYGGEKSHNRQLRLWTAALLQAMVVEINEDVPIYKKFRANS